MSNLSSRVEKLEHGAGLNVCPCQTPKLIEHVTVNADTDAVIADGPHSCERCGRPLPITQIVAVRPRMRGFERF